MKVARLLCAIWVCAPLALDASAAESPERGGSPVADMGQEAGRAALGRDTSIKAGRAETRESAQVDSGKGSGSKSRNAAADVSPRRGSVRPQRGVGRLAHSNADRLHSLLSKQARGRLANASSRPVGSNGAATGSDGVVRGPRGSNPVGGPKLAVSKNASQATTSAKTVVGESSIGGPHAGRLGRLGGPPIGRTANRAAIDGTQLHRKF
jgi:hypothetical protein